MKMRTSCVLIFASFLPLIIGSSSERNCHQQCDSLVAQLEKKAATEKGFDLTRELGEICNAGSSCNGISQEQMAEIIGRFMTRSSAEVCEETCTSTDKGQRSGSHGVEKGLKIVAKRDVDDDDDDDDVEGPPPGWDVDGNYKEKAPDDEESFRKKEEDEEKRSPARWAVLCSGCLYNMLIQFRSIKFPVENYGDFGSEMCGAIFKGRNSFLRCQAVAKEVNVPALTSANRICVASGFCNRGKNLCTFKNAKSSGSFFDTVFSIASIFSEVTRPLKGLVRDWRSSFLLVDESVKCHKPGERPSDFEETIYSPLTAKKCKLSCSKMTDFFKQKLKLGQDHSDRKKFEEFCNGMIYSKQRQRCHAVHNSTDMESILQTIIQKQLCPKMSCIAPESSWEACRNCDFWASYGRSTIEVGNEALAVLSKRIKIICTAYKDERCSKFLARFESFVQKFKAMTVKNKLCKSIGFC